MIQKRARYLDPVERFSEIAFGLIMVLSFTCGISIAQSDRSDVRLVLLTAVGCNIAWGTIDAVFYLIRAFAETARSQRRPEAKHYFGALAVFLIVVTATLPVILPFVFIENLALAHRTSNATAIVLLFIAGYRLAQYSGLRPWLTGFILVAVGSSLVALTIFLGG